MKHFVIALVLSLGLLPGLTRAAEPSCKRSPALTGKCSMVSGSLGLTRDVGTTLETDDGNRILITAPPDSNADIAPVVMQNWLYWQSRTASMSTRIHGTYEICPLPPQSDKPGITQFACINSGKRITQDKAAQ